MLNFPPNELENQTRSRITDNSLRYDTSFSHAEVAKQTSEAKFEALLKNPSKKLNDNVNFKKPLELLKRYKTLKSCFQDTFKCNTSFESLPNASTLSKKESRASFS